MQIISHRRNLVDELAATPRDCGVEIDVRSQGSSLVLHHDPFAAGTRFDVWLEKFAHGTLILNVKEEGLEDALLALMASRGISDFFFLDQSFPFLVRTSGKGERRSAVRVSEYEGLTCARALAGRIDWAWIDCFTKFPLTRADADKLVGMGYKLCLVSPELQGRDTATGIPAMRALVDKLGIRPDAVCTKRADLWR
jgi:hypothetical protein